MRRAEVSRAAVNDREEVNSIDMIIDSQVDLPKCSTCRVRSDIPSAQGAGEAAESNLKGAT